MQHKGLVACTYVAVTYIVVELDFKSAMHATVYSYVFSLIRPCTDSHYRLHSYTHCKQSTIQL